MSEDDEGWLIPVGGDSLREDAPLDSSQLADHSYPCDITPQQLAELDVSELEKRVTTAEMASCDLYLHNLHASFPKATSVNSLVKLVTTCIGVHRHRRDVLTTLKENSQPKGDTIEIGVTGGIIKKV